MTDHITIIRGVGGSHSHGLATETSDIDEYGVYSYPTEAFWSLRKLPDSKVHNDPDYTLHELEKFLSLAAKSNPTVLESLFYEEYLELEEGWGETLLAIRSAFPTARYVHGAYMGYAEAQFRKLSARHDSFSSGTRNRTNKHARHMFRLMEAGYRLYSTGELRVKVDDPESYLRYNDMSVEQISEEFTDRWMEFTEAKSPLPAEPDWGLINDYLFEYRKAH